VYIEVYIYYFPVYRFSFFFKHALSNLEMLVPVFSTLAHWKNMPLPTSLLSVTKANFKKAILALLLKQMCFYPTFDFFCLLRYCLGFVLVVLYFQKQ